MKRILSLSVVAAVFVLSACSKPAENKAEDVAQVPSLQLLAEDLLTVKTSLSPG